MVTTPAVVMLAIWSRSGCVNHNLPSLPLVIP